MSKDSLVKTNQPPPSGHRIPTTKTSSSRRRNMHRSHASVDRVADLEERRDSLPLAQLKDLEVKFFALVEAGDVSEVEKFFNNNRNLNVNCINYKGLGALHIAIKNENDAMVKLLLRRIDIDVKDAALHAVATGNIPLTEMILDHVKTLNPEQEVRGGWESADYPLDMSPLALASQCGDFKMVRMLLERGHEIDKPHPPTCLCQSCKTLIRDRGTSLSQTRLHAFRAISNPAYICQVTSDPILYAFLLDKEVKECALVDKEFRKHYQELGDSVREFTVTLLSKCRDSEEVEMLLKLPMGYDTQRHHAKFPRLQLALDYYQKEFVAQSMVQQVLSVHWLGEFRSWARLSFHMKMAHVLVRILLFPFICIALLVAPWLKPLRKFHSPVNRFLMSLASYLIFLFLVFLLNILDTGSFQRGAPRTGLEGIIVIFTLGHIWSTIRQLKAEGCGRFFSVPWNWYDIFMEFLFLMTYLFWIAADEVVKDDETGQKEAKERKFWESNDPTLLHEGLFAIATVLAAGKLGYFCLQSTRLGPLQVSMGKMAVQIAYFLVLCFLINASFAFPLSRMYAYYDGMTQTTPSGSRSQQSSFTSFSNSFATLFWGMFGMSAVESADVVIENLSDDVKNPIINTHDFTQGVGRMLFAIYELLMLIALVNTLIAILSDTFQRVVDNADVEFKFHRTKMWSHFFQDRTFLPSPFNLLPSHNCLKFCTTYMRSIGKKKSGDKAKFSFTRCCYIEHEKEDPAVDIVLYEALMANLVQRYFSAVDDEEEEED